MTRKPKPKSERPRGRPTAYTPELALLLCERLAAGESLRAICQDESMPDERTVRGWAIDNREGFFPQYARARQIQAMGFGDEIIEIADTPVEGERIEEQRVEGENGQAIIERKVHREDMLGHRKLQVESRKWWVSKVLPKVFGDKLAIGGDPDAPPIQMSDADRAARVRALVAAAEARKAKAEKAEKKR